jgi:hypothetical protein
VFSREDEMKVIPVDMEDGEQKTALFQLMRDLAAHDKIVKAVVLITEAWSLTTGSKDYDGESIEHTPGRTEIVLLSAIMSNMQMIAKAPIDRLGNVSILGIFEIESGEKLKGRMALD